MPAAPLPRIHHVTTPEQDNRIEDAVNERLIARDNANFDGFVENLPGEGVFFPKRSPREELVFYEAQGATYWANFYASAFDLARQAFRRFADLAIRYRSISGAL